MDWLLDAFSVLDDPEVCFVAGFKADEVVERYPSVRTIFNRDWLHGGPMQSLGLAPLGPAHDTYVCYADVVFRRSAVAMLADASGDAVFAVDSRWRDRYEGRSRRDLDVAERVRLVGDQVVEAGAGVEVDGADVAEFAGVLRLTGPAAEATAGAIGAGALEPTTSLPALAGHLLDRGFAVTAVDLAGGWAELDAKQDLARFVLGTKAESLERLRSMSHGGEIAELVSFTYGDWLADRDAVIDRVLGTIGSDQLIVRSSALAEDSWHESAAGQYQSVLDVDRAPEAVAGAVDAVFASYGSEDPANQVLVQEMLRDVAMSGVVMTRTHTLGAPYYVLNFDDSTSRTDTVTGGGESRTVFVHRGSPLRADLPPALTDVLGTVQSIEKLVGHDSLDIEFAVTRDGRVHILQVRPIAITHTPDPIDDDKVAAALVAARRFLTERTPPPPTLLGRRTRYSVMSDWNPAEIVGTKPKRLAMSLYRHIITDDVWAQQRARLRLPRRPPVPAAGRGGRPSLRRCPGDVQLLRPRGPERRTRDEAGRRVPRPPRSAPPPARQGRVRRAVHLPHRGLRRPGGPDPSARLHRGRDRGVAHLAARHHRGRHRPHRRRPGPARPVRGTARGHRRDRARPRSTARTCCSRRRGASPRPRSPTSPEGRSWRRASCARWWRSAPSPRRTPTGSSPLWRRCSGRCRPTGPAWHGASSRGTPSSRPTGTCVRAPTTSRHPATGPLPTRTCSRWSRTCDAPTRRRRGRGPLPIPGVRRTAARSPMPSPGWGLPDDVDAFCTFVRRAIAGREAREVRLHQGPQRRHRVPRRRSAPSTASPGRTSRTCASATSWHAATCSASPQRS